MKRWGWKMTELTLQEINITPIKPRNGLQAFCSFVINNSFYVGDVALYSRLDGSYRLVYPIKVLANGAKVNCFHPINDDVRSIIETRVTQAYLELIEKVKKKERNNDDKSEIKYETIQ
jgi:stage V sporulation protein G